MPDFPPNASRRKVVTVAGVKAKEVQERLTGARKDERRKTND
jgi:hypothetical protein